MGHCNSAVAVWVADGEPGSGLAIGCRVHRRPRYPPQRSWSPCSLQAPVQPGEARFTRRSPGVVSQALYGIAAFSMLDGMALDEY
jgi:hypothetical protein